MTGERQVWIIRMDAGSEPMRLNYHFHHAAYRGEVVVSQAGRAAVFGSPAMARFGSQAEAEAERERLATKRPGLLFEVDVIHER